MKCDSVKKRNKKRQTATNLKKMNRIVMTNFSNQELQSKVIIYLIINRTKIYGVITFGIFWYFGYWFRLDGFSVVSIFFFTAGAYFGMNKHNLLYCFGKFRNMSFVSYPLIAVADLLTKGLLFNSYIHKAGILIGIVFCFNLVAFLFKKERIKSIPFLSAASFFVFAMREPLLTILRKITILIVNPKSDASLIILYFLNVMIVITLTFVSYWLLRKILPKFTLIITGGR